MNIVMVEPRAGNEYGVSVLLLNRIADYLRRRGESVHILNPSRDKLPARLIELTQDPDSILYLGNYYFDMTVSAENQLLDANIIEMINRPTICFIGDHPMTQFMWRRIRHAAANPIYHVIDDGLSKELGYLSENAFRTVARSAPYVYECDDRIQADAKPFDLFVPVNIGMDAMPIDAVQEAFQAGSKWRLIAGDFHDLLLADGLVRPAVDLFESVVGHHLGADLKSFRARNQQIFQILLKIFSDVDLSARSARRVEICKRMLRSAGSRRVLVASPKPETGPIASMELPKTVEFTGFLTPKAVGQTMARSKLVLNISPTYSDCIHERVVTTLASHSVPLTDETNEIKRELRAEVDYVPLSPDLGLDELFERFPADRLDAMARSGREKVVPKYAPEAYFDMLADMARQGSASA